MGRIDYKKLTNLNGRLRHLRISCFCQRRLISRLTLTVQCLGWKNSLTTPLPRVNFLAVIAGILALVSILFPWWGITATGFGGSTSSMWGLFGGPSHNPDINNASSFSNTITAYTPIVLVLVLLSTALAVAGSFAPRLRVLLGGLVTSIAALVGYAALIGYTASNNCQGNGCISSSTGSESIFGVTLTWGFQLGFYLFTAATILVLIGLVFHETLTKHRSRAETSKQNA